MARSAEPCKLTTSIVVDCDIQQCWDLYIDNTLVTEWAPAVKQVESKSSILTMGSTRKSHVLVDGKSGHTVEQCSLIDQLKRVNFDVVEETFGFAHMLTSYGYSVSFGVEGQQTLLVMETHYTPKKIFASLMNAKATQQQLLDLMSTTLSGFKHYAEKQTKS